MPKAHSPCSPTAGPILIHEFLRVMMTGLGLKMNVYVWETLSFHRRFLFSSHLLAAGKCMYKQLQFS